LKDRPRKEHHAVKTIYLTLDIVNTIFKEFIFLSFYFCYTKLFGTFYFFKGLQNLFHHYSSNSSRIKIVAARAKEPYLEQWIEHPRVHRESLLQLLNYKL